MIRYRLDDLGWYQFEWLVQALLKTQLGMGIEAWGGHGDYGRDAYFAESLAYPTKDLREPGPFLFQVKFVENANAAGARPAKAVLNAIRKESVSIRDRKRLPWWKEPAHYTLITNAPLDAATRQEVERLIAEALPETKVHSHGADDVCALLDTHTGLRRSFPQLLSLRDLDELIREAVNADTIERSRAAIECAREVVQVFVPTGAYEKTWKVLRAKHFAVLEGPPEMGKTAVAWMIALSQMSQGWQAIVCDNPDTFFGSLNHEIPQIFVADDAFGRTEYDPARGNKWEKDLHRVLRAVDSTHWLVWTSRKHILERARRVMDLQGDATKFPQPGEVLVDASQLSEQEKALILYRHARAAGLEDPAKNLVRKQARSIVQHRSFTPERIRWFVRERLPEIAVQLGKRNIKPAMVQTQVLEAIKNPTERMRKAFKALAPSQKWLLIALLESDARREVSSLQPVYELHCPSDVRRPFQDVLDELTEAFVKTGKGGYFFSASQNRWVDLNSSDIWVDWTHPSCRDLVIEELVADPVLLMRFVRLMSLQGIKLAISDSGGTSGQRTLPLMTSPETWQRLSERCVDLAKERPASEVADLLSALQNAASQTSDTVTKDRLVRIIGEVCKVASDSWDESETAMSARELAAYCDASKLASPLPRLPRLEASWCAADERFVNGLEQSEQSNALIDVDDWLNEWIQLLSVIRRNEPRLWEVIATGDGFSERIGRLVEVTRADLEAESSFDYREQFEEEAQRLNSLADMLGDLPAIAPPAVETLSTLSEELRARAAYLEEEASEAERANRDQEEDDDGYREAAVTDAFSIDALFSDL
jgi:hypothetical protein